MKIRYKNTACCAPTEDKKSPCCPPPKADEKQTARFLKTTSVWSWQDRIGEVKCRLGSFRMKYMVEPGLYAIGSPDKNSDVFVSANYKLSFDILRRSLSGVNGWILALDTKGINVWCAAGKGTFGTDELVKRVYEARLYDVVSHKRLIVPQLGAPGVAAHEVKRATGFHVHYGPVRAEDLQDYIKAGYKATEDMRRVEFPAVDRLVLTPMEVRPALKIYAVYAVLMLAIFGLAPSGISFSKAWQEGGAFLILGVLSILSGAVLTPLLLPFIPLKAFSIKGWLTGIVVTVAGLYLLSGLHPLLSASSLLFFPLASSYMALQFTGASTYTNMSGVRKELSYAVPVYIAGALASLMILAAYKVFSWGTL